MINNPMTDMKMNGDKKMDEKFMEFLDYVNESDREFVKELNDFLLEKGLKCEIKAAKSGPVVSYITGKTKKTVVNFVCRKSGIKVRIYANNVKQYESFLNELPEKMKKDIKKSSVCKRLINPEDCNSRCAMGYDFMMDGERFQKCRYMAFMPTVTEENNPFIRRFLEKELSPQE